MLTIALSVLFVVAALMNGFLAYHAWVHRTVAARWFAALMGAVAFWSLAAAPEAVATTESSKIFWSQVSYVGVSSVPFFWFCFAAAYTQRFWWLRQTRIILFAIPPVVLLLLVLTNGWHGLVWPSVTLMHMPEGVFAHYDHGPAVWFHVFYAYLMLAAGSLMLLQLLPRSLRLYSTQTLLLLVAVVVPWIANFAYMARIGMLGLIDLTPLGFTVSGAAIAWTMLRHQFLDIAPVAYQTLFARLSDGVIVLDGSRRIVLANPAALRMLGLTSNMVGRPATDVLPPVLRTITGSQKPEGIVHEVTLGDRTIEVTIVPLTAAWEVNAAAMLLLGDVTDRTRRAEDLLRSGKAESLALMSGGIAHTYNNLLQILLLNTSAARAQLDAQHPLHRQLESIEHTVERAASLTQQLLMYTGGLFTTRRIVSLTAVLREHEPKLRSFLPQDVPFTLQLSRTSLPVEVDSRLLIDAIRNVLINAGESIEGSMGAVTLSVQDYTLTADTIASWGRYGSQVSPGLYAMIEVRDTGSGIPPEHMDRLFDPFFSTKFLGRGMGLPATLGIIRLHGGAVQVVSERGKGTTVSMLIPLSTDEFASSRR